MSFSNIVGIQELRDKVEKMGVRVTDIDMTIADVIFKHTNDCVRILERDDDGIMTEYAAGFIYNDQVQNLINTFPAAALMIYYLDRKSNYGFLNSQTGEVKREGMMGSYDSILGAKAHVAAYIGTRFDRAHLFDNVETFEQWKKDTSYRSLGAIASYGVDPMTYYSERGSYDPKSYYEGLSNELSVGSKGRR